MFKKMVSRKKSQHVVEQIMSAITDGQISVGEKLPSEQEIADMTGVSRPSVREALGIMRFAGVLETRLGDGTYVKKTSWGGLRGNVAEVALVRLLQQGKNPADVIFARRVIERGTISAAATSIGASGLEELEVTFEQLKFCVNGSDADGFIEWDHKFHLAIASAGGNVLLKSILESLLSSMETDEWKSGKRDYVLGSADKRKVIATHESILTAIREGNESAAVIAANLHFDISEKLFFSN